MRLLIALFLLSLIQQASLAQQSGTALPYNLPYSCPVTKPPTVPFVPSPPYTEKVPPTSFLYGTDELWTSLPTTGTWKGLPHYTPDDPSFRQKLFWWRQGFDWRTEPPRLKVTGRRLDSPAPPLMSDGANSGWQNRDQPFMVTGINLPTLGCWEITGYYGDRALSFVVWVAE